jgi:EpsI family protein
MKLKQTLIAATIMLTTSISLAYLKTSDDQPLKRSLSDFPTKIAEWQGTKSRFDEKVYEVLGVDDSTLVNYYNQNRENIQLYIGYYQSQREGDIIHSPKNCMPGSGWNIVSTSLMQLDLKYQNGNPIQVIKLVLQNGIQRQVALYWFHSRGRVITSEYTQKIYLVWDSITKHRTDGSFVRLVSPVTDQNESQTTERLKQFTEQLFPILNEFIPT